MSDFKITLICLFLLNMWFELKMVIENCDFYHLDDIFVKILQFQFCKLKLLNDENIWRVLD